MDICRGGGTGRREGLKSLCQPTDVWVRVPPPAQNTLSGWRGVA